MYQASQTRNETLAARLRMAQGQPIFFKLTLKGEFKTKEEKAQEEKLAAIKAVYGE